MQLAFEDATDARSRKFLSEGMKLGALAIEGDAGDTNAQRTRTALGEDYDFEREMFDAKPLRDPKRGR